MIDLDNRTSGEIELALLEKITESVTQKDIEVVVCDDATIREINRQYRQKDSATDVLSFPFEPMEHAPLGTVVISFDKVAAKAAELGHTQNQEFALLYIHGLLHLLGFDHEKDGGQMRQKERELIERFGLPQSLIVRTETK